jgi:internalin A
MTGEENHHLALVQSFPHERLLELTVRGPYPQNFFALLVDGLDLTLDRFPGLQIRRFIPCPGHGGEPCAYEFAYEHVLRYLDARRSEIECQATLEPVSVTALLWGWSPRTRDMVLARIDQLSVQVRTHHETVVETLGDVLASSDATLQELVELRQLAQREFLNAFRREQRLADVQCPNVFVIVPRDRAGWQRAAELFRGQQYELQLYCQEPGCWHPTPDGGRYEISNPAEWLRRTAPLLKTLVNVLKFAAPIVGPWIGMMDPKEYAHGVQYDVSLMKELVMKLPEVRVAKGADGSEASPANGDEGSEVQGAALRAVRALLDEKDPAQAWGGLERVVTPEGHVLWLCEHHAEGYRAVA